MPLTSEEESFFKECWPIVYSLAYKAYPTCMFLSFLYITN